MPKDVYNSTLIKTRSARQEITGRALDRLAKEYANMVLMVSARAGTGAITAERAEALSRSIRAQLAAYGKSAEGSIGSGAEQLANLAGKAHEFALSALAKQAGVNATQSFASVPRAALEYMMHRRGLAEDLGLTGFSGLYKALVSRNLQAAAADIDSALMRAVGTGQSWETTTMQLARRLANDDPAVFDALKHLGPRGGKTAAAFQSGVQIDDGTLKRAKRLLGDMRRIAVHEHNSVYDEADKIAAVYSPVVEALIWQISGRHAGLSSAPDVCDLIAQADAYELGTGVYPCDACPSLPHPYCLCTTRKKLRGPADWNKPKPSAANLKPKQMQGNSGQKILFEARTPYTGNLTKAKVTREVKRANKMLRLAHEGSGPLGRRAGFPSGDGQVTPPPVPAGPAPFPSTLDGLRTVKRLGGSTGAELVEDATGGRFVLKRGGNADHIREEVAADAMYRAMGYNVPEMRLYETPGGPAKLARFVEGKTLREHLAGATDAQRKKIFAEIQDGFGADALLGNWDVIGLEYDNILVDAAGKAWRIDNGGSLRFRAQGGRKAVEQFGAEVVELQSMRGLHPTLRPNDAALTVFGSMSDDAVRAQVLSVLRRSDELLAAAPEELVPLLKARINWLRNFVEPDLFTAEVAERVAAARISGHAVLIDRLDVEDAQALMWWEKKADGTPVTLLQFKLTNEGANGLMQRMRPFIVEGADLDPVFDEDSVVRILSDAAKTVNHHVKQGDFAYNAGKLDAVNDALSMIKDAVFEGVISKADADRYRDLARQITEAAAGKSAAPFINKLGIKVTPKMPAKGGAFSVRKEDLKYGLKNYDPAEPGVATSTTGYSMQRLPGYVTDIDGAGVRFKAYNAIPDDKQYAFQGMFQIAVEGMPSTATLGKLKETLVQLGLDARPASDEFLQSLYLFKGINFRRDLFKMGDLADAGAILADRAIDDAERIVRLRGIVEKAGLKAPDGATLAELARGAATKSDGSGWRHWTRWDLTAEDLEKEMAGYQLTHHTGTNPGDLVRWLLQQGGDFTPTTERARKGIDISQGMSPWQDINYGTSNYLFTRIAERAKAKALGQFRFKIGTLARMDALTHKADWLSGSREIWRNEVRTQAGHGVRDYKAFSKNSSNETLFKWGLSLLDDIEEIVVTPAQRPDVLRAFKEAGIERLPDGRRIEDIVKTK